MSIGAAVFRILRDFTKANSNHLTNQFGASWPKVFTRKFSVDPGIEEGLQAEQTELQSKGFEHQELKEIDPKDRSVQIPVGTSIRYLQSQAYITTYGTEPVWVPYRRNFKGQIPPLLTRKSCIKRNRLQTGNPCPICRDEYLVIHETNVELLKQFISPFTGEVLPWR